MINHALLCLALLSSALPAAAAAAASERVPMTEQEKLDWYCSQHKDEGDNCRAHALLLLPYISDYARYPDSDNAGNTIVEDPCGFSPKPPGCDGGNAPSVGSQLPETNEGDGPVKPKILVYPTWSSAPHHMNYGRVLADYNGTGPGTIISLGFKALGGNGSFAWSEDVNSTDHCAYLGWISQTPGDVPADGGLYCGVIETPYTGAYRAWIGASAADVNALKKTATSCVLRAGGQYYFNLALKSWGKNPYSGVLSCIEHITPQGAGAVYYFKE